MSLLPIFLKLEGRPCLLVGAGTVALEKIGSLLKTGLRLRVVAPEARAEVKELAAEGKIEWVSVEALFDGLRIMQERSFDLIISDLFLPDGQGMATVRHLKQHAPQTPVIAEERGRHESSILAFARSDRRTTSASWRSPESRASGRRSTASRACIPTRSCSSNYWLAKADA